MNFIDKFKNNITLDTANINFIKKYKINNVTTNPSLVLEVIKQNMYIKLLNDYLYKNYLHNVNIIDNKKIYILYMIIAKEILKYINGDLSIELNPNYCFNINKSVNEALNIIEFFQLNNINIKKILIKIPASIEGIKIAQILENKNIKCNLTLIFSLIQAKLAADKGVYLISPFIGRIYDWYYNKSLIKLPYNIKLDPGIKLINYIIEEYKIYNYKTIIMAASFRNIEQIIAASKCDRLTISPSLLDLLKNRYVYSHINYNIINIIKKNTKNKKNKFLNLFNDNKMAINQFNKGLKIFQFDYKLLLNYLYKSFF